MNKSFFIKSYFYFFLNLIILIFCLLAMNPAIAEVNLSFALKGLDNAKAENNALNRLTQTVQSLPKPLTPENAENFYHHSESIVADGIKPFGYFNPLIHSELQKSGDHWQISYEISPGSPTRIIATQIFYTGAGKNNPLLLKLLNPPNLKIQDIFISPIYERYKQTLLNTANDQGFIDAYFSQHEVLINKKEHTAVIKLTLDTGDKYYFGAVSFNKNPLNSHFLQRFVPFKSGDAYSTNQVEQLSSDLRDSGYFSSVNVVPHVEKPDPNHTIPVAVHLKAMPRQQYILGLGYGSDTGARATLGSTWHYVNSYGHRFNTLLRLSHVQNTASAKYIIPGNNPLKDQYNINASLQTNNINQGSSTLKQLGLGYTFSAHNWQHSFALSERIERYSIFNAPYQTSHLLLPSYQIDYMIRNNLLFPTEGQHFTVNVSGTSPALTSDTRLFQTTINEKWIHSFNTKNIILLRGNLGYTSIHNLNLLPLSLNFFAGGLNSVRGYGYNNLGPGRYLAVASAEYRYRVYKKWYATTFYDVGNAFNNIPQAPSGTLSSRIISIYHLLYQGAGVGVVWDSPVGAMALSYAKEVNVTHQPGRIQFDLGSNL